METVVVLGSDQLGTDVVRRLEDGDVARVLTAGTLPGIGREHHRKLDFRDRAAGRRLADLLTAESPQTVVDLTVSRSPVSPPKRRRNHDSVAARAVAAGVRLWVERGGRPRALVVLSSTSVYGLARTAPLLFDEAFAGPRFEPEPSSAYSRWAADLREREDVLATLATDVGCDLTILRAAAAAGGPIASPLSDYFASRRAVRVLGYDPPVQVIHYSDLVEAVVRAVTDRVAGVINVVGRGVVPLTRAAALSGRLLAPLPRTAARLLAHDALGTAPLCWRCVADGARAVQTLGFVPKYSAEEALSAEAPGA